MSSLVERLNGQIRLASDEGTRGELSAQIACYLARIGDAEGCANLLQELRTKFGRGNFPRVSVWLMIAEGISVFFGGLSENSRDRLVRACEISRVAGYSDLGRLSSAWLSHMEFNRGDYSSMARYLCSADPVSEQRRDAADCRAFVVLADSSLYCGNYDDAIKWHEIARRIAVDLGDEATIGAIIYNKAMFSCLRVQTNWALDRYEAQPAEFLGMLVDSTDYFDRAARHTSLQQLTTTLRARQRMAVGKFSEASHLYREVIDSELPTSYVDDAVLLKSEMALSMLKAGDVALALDLAKQLITGPRSELSTDASLIFWSCLDEVAKLSGNEQMMDSTGAQRKEAAERFLEETALVQTALTEVKSHLTNL